MFTFLSFQISLCWYSNHCLHSILLIASLGNLSQHNSSPCLNIRLYPTINSLLSNIPISLKTVYGLLLLLPFPTLKKLNMYQITIQTIFKSVLQIILWSKSKQIKNHLILLSLAVWINPIIISPFLIIAIIWM